MKKMTIGFMGGMLVLLLLTGCSGTGPSGQREDNTLARQETDAGVEEEAEDRGRTENRGDWFLAGKGRIAY